MHLKVGKRRRSRASLEHVGGLHSHQRLVLGHEGPLRRASGSSDVLSHKIRGRVDQTSTRNPASGGAQGALHAPNGVVQGHVTSGEATLDQPRANPRRCRWRHRRAALLSPVQPELGCRARAFHRPVGRSRSRSAPRAPRTSRHWSPVRAAASARARAPPRDDEQARAADPEASAGVVVQAQRSCTTRSTLAMSVRPQQDVVRLAEHDQPRGEGISGRRRGWGRCAGSARRSNGPTSGCSSAGATARG